MKKTACNTDSEVESILRLLGIMLLDTVTGKKGKNKQIRGVLVDTVPGEQPLAIIIDEKTSKEVAVDIFTIRRDQNVDRLSASEALYGFCGWLTSRKEHTYMGSTINASLIPDLIQAFIQANQLQQPRDTWHKLLTHPAKPQPGHSIKELLGHMIPDWVARIIWKGNPK